jgi:hypothetical protein
MGHFDWPMAKKQKLKLEILSKITISMWGWYASNLAHIYRWKGENFGQRIWDKVKCYRQHLWGTHWELGEHREELIENLGHIWEHDGNTRIKKNSILAAHPLPTPLTPMGKDEPSWVYIQSSHWLHIYSIPKEVDTNFFALANTLLQSTPYLSSTLI